MKIQRTSAILYKWISAVKNAGIKKITGADYLQLQGLFFQMRYLMVGYGKILEIIMEPAPFYH